MLKDKCFIAELWNMGQLQSARNLRHYEKDQRPNARNFWGIG